MVWKTARQRQQSSKLLAGKDWFVPTVFNANLPITEDEDPVQSLLLENFHSSKCTAIGSYFCRSKPLHSRCSETLYFLLMYSLGKLLSPKHPTVIVRKSLTHSSFQLLVIMMLKKGKVLLLTVATMYLFATCNGNLIDNVCALHLLHWIDPLMRFFLETCLPLLVLQAWKRKNTFFSLFSCVVVDPVFLSIRTHPAATDLTGFILFWFLSNTVLLPTSDNSLLGYHDFTNWPGL